jgi:hypothetical protein
MSISMEPPLGSPTPAALTCPLRFSAVMATVSDRPWKVPLRRPRRSSSIAPGPVMSGGRTFNIDQPLPRLSPSSSPPSPPPPMVAQAGSRARPSSTVRRATGVMDREYALTAVAKPS